jgi:hypothetical protein
MTLKEWIKKVVYGIEPVVDIPNIEPIVQGNVRRYVIPVGGMTRKEAERQIVELMNTYNDDVKWDENNGELNINGNTQIPFQKDYWFPQENWSKTYKKFVKSFTPEQQKMMEESRLIYNRCGPHHPRRVFTIPIGKKKED